MLFCKIAYQSYSERSSYFDFVNVLNHRLLHGVMSDEFIVHLRGVQYRLMSADSILSGHIQSSSCVLHVVIIECYR